MVPRKKSKNDRRPERRPPSGTLGAAGKILVLLALAVMAGVGWWRYAARSEAPVSPSTAATFHPSVENTRAAPGDPPRGMVWIPGGEFSMGAAESPGMNMVGMQATTDSRPVHRVYVDGFWMDTTEVTNAAVRERSSRPPGM